MAFPESERPYITPTVINDDKANTMASTKQSAVTAVNFAATVLLPPRTEAERIERKPVCVSSIPMTIAQANTAIRTKMTSAE